MDILELVQEEARRQGVDPALALSIARAESGGSPNAISPKGAIGPMQLMPATARELGVNPRNVAENIRGGVSYLRQQLDRFGSPELAAAAYNAGPGNVQKYGGVPPFPETQKYVQKVTGMQDDSDIFGSPKQAKQSQDDGDIFAPVKPSVSLKPAEAPKKEVGAWDAFKQSVDVGSQRLADGLLQLYYGGQSDPNASKVLQGLSTLRQQQEAAFKPVEQAHPFIAGAGVSAPSILASAIPGLGLAGTAAAAALPEALSYGSAGDRAGRAVLAGGTTWLGGKIGQKVGDFLTGRIGSQVAPETLQAAEKINAPMTLGQRTGSPTIQKFEDMLMQSPGSSGVMARTGQQQQQAVNRAIGSQIGMPGTSRLGQAEITTAEQGINATRQALKDAVTVNPVHPDVLSGINAAERTLKMQKGPALDYVEKSPVVKYINDWVANGAPLNGEEYQSVRTMVREALDNADNSKAIGSGALERYLKAFKTGLDKAAQGSASDAWKKSDVAYSTMEMLSKPGVWNPATGDVSPKMFSNAFIRQYGMPALEGKLPGPASDVMMFAKGVRDYPTGSQTAPREMFGTLGGWALAAPKWLAAQAVTSQPIGRLAANGLLTDSPLLRRALMQSGETGALAGGEGLLMNAYPGLFAQ